MHAHDRFLPDWFNRIRGRQLTLPRFQRFVAWGHAEVSGLLTTVLQGLPSGAALILEVGDEEKFASRPMTDAPTTGGRVTEQLLDGQQRLTALWRSLNDKYTDRTYLVGFEQSEESSHQEPRPYGYGQARWTNKGRRYPVWVDSPLECWKRGFIPLRLLRPEDIQQEIDDWIEKALAEEVGDKFAAYRRVLAVINGLRTKIREFNLPYLALKASTSKEVALDVFIKMNTSSVKLSTYDIVVALVEEETGKSLHDHVAALDEQVPRAKQYSELPGLVLDVVALMQDRVPSQSGYKGIDYKRLLQEWDQVVAGVKWAVRLLEEESVFDEQRLPTSTPLSVLAALAPSLPLAPDRLGNARHLLRGYLWRSFLTTRYEQSSTSLALQDYRALRKSICDPAIPVNDIPIFNDALYPTPPVESLLLAGWPKARTILGRGIVALSLRCGAEDLADGARATVASITSLEHPREYHHLFPASLLEEAGVSDEEVFRSLNCALITGKTNRTISNKDPMTYLRDRVVNGSRGEPELRWRLKTHLIPFDELSVGYAGLTAEAKHQRVRADYANFLSARARIMHRAAKLACDGRTQELNAAYDSLEDTAS